MTITSNICNEVFKKDFPDGFDNQPGLFIALKKCVFNPGYRVCVYYRFSVFLKEQSTFKRVFRFLSNLIIIRICRVPGVEIRTSLIGQGLKLMHPHDVVIGAGARIGNNVTIYNGVTLGAKTIWDRDDIKEVSQRYPTIGDHVVIFSGAKILGPVKIGSNSIIGANAVVLKSFPSYSIIVGAPAKKVGVAA